MKYNRSNFGLGVRVWKGNTHPDYQFTAFAL